MFQLLSVIMIDESKVRIQNYIPYNDISFVVKMFCNFSSDLRNIKEVT